MAKYNSKIVKEICGNISRGFSNKDAALLSDISEETFYFWTREKPEFTESIKKARAKRKQYFIEIIEQAAKKQWQAAAWYLERNYPNEFGRNREITKEPYEKETHELPGGIFVHMVKMARNHVPGESNIDKLIEKLEEQHRNEEKQKSEISNVRHF